jgi:hypothetical protein
MVRTRRPEGCQPGVLGAADEVEDDIAVVVVADHRPVRGREAADQREQRGGSGVALLLRERGNVRHQGSERIWPAMVGDE